MTVTQRLPTLIGTYTAGTQNGTVLSGVVPGGALVPGDMVIAVLLGHNDGPTSPWITAQSGYPSFAVTVRRSGVKGTQLAIFQRRVTANESGLTQSFSLSPSGTSSYTGAGATMTASVLHMLVYRNCDYAVLAPSTVRSPGIDPSRLTDAGLPNTADHPAFRALNIWGVGIDWASSDAISIGEYENNGPTALTSLQSEVSTGSILSASGKHGVASLSITQTSANLSSTSYAPGLAANTTPIWDSRIATAGEYFIARLYLPAMHEHSYTAAAALSQQITTPYTAATALSQQITKPYTARATVSQQITKPYTARATLDPKKNRTAPAVAAFSLQTTRPYTVATTVSAELTKPYTASVSLSTIRSYLARAALGVNVSKSYSAAAAASLDIVKSYTASATLSAQVYRAYTARASLWQSQEYAVTPWGSVPGLLRHLPSAMLHGDPDAAPRLQVTTYDRLARISVHGYYLAVNDLAESAASMPSVLIDLRTLSLGHLAATITALTGSRAVATVVNAAESALHATLLLEQQWITGGAGAPMNLTGWTSDTWRVLWPLACAIEGLRIEVMDNLSNLDLRTADCDWLRAWGEILGLPRLADEACEAHRQRLIYAHFRPRCNNKALEILVRDALGIDCDVSDENTTPFTWAGSSPGLRQRWAGGSITTTQSKWSPSIFGQFVVTLPSTGTYTAEQVRAVIETYKAVGTEFRMVLTDSAGHPAYVPWLYDARTLDATLE